jgi:hypothetical protein
VKLALPAGSTSVIVHVFALDASETTGAGKTALAFGDITAYYVRAGGTLTALTPVDITTLGTWDTDVIDDKIGFKLMHNDNAPGLYEVHLPNNILAAGANQVTVQLRATDMAPIVLEIQLAGVDVAQISNDATAAATLELFAEALDQSTGQLDAGSLHDDTITAAAIATGAVDADALAADAITAINDDVIDTIDNNSGYDRLTVYGGDKLFDLASGESWATWPSVVYDSDAANWRCYYNALFDSKRCIRMRTSTDGKTNWSDPTTVLLPADVGTTYLVTSVVWRESAGDWRMLYTAFAVNSNIHYATSTDGLTWTDYGSNPVISADQDWDVGTAGRHFIEVTGVMKVGTTYYIYFGSINTGEQRKTGVAWTTDFVTFTRQTDPVFGDSGMSNVQEPYSGYFSGTPFTSAITGGIYYLLVTPYEHGTQYSRMEMWASSSPLFPASNRRLVKTILTCGHGTVFPNRKLDAISIATDNVSQNTFTAASNEIRIYFGAEHSSGDDGTKVWYTALATATNIYDLLKPIDVSREITRGRLPQQRGQLTQSNIDAILADTGTDGVVISTATQQAIATALLDLANAVDGKTLRQAIQYIAAVVAGELSGAGTGTETVNGLDGTTARATFTVDEDGNRTAVSYDPT